LIDHRKIQVAYAGDAVRAAWSSQPFPCHCDDAPAIIKQVHGASPFAHG
jgi:hypothetical protein